MSANTTRPNPKLSDLVDDYLVVTIELGINGGYIATIGDDATGIESRNIWAAVRSARSRLPKAVTA